MSAEEHLQSAQFFHGSAHRIVRGGVISPGNAAGVNSHWGTGDYAHATTDLHNAAWYGKEAASHRGFDAAVHVYRVEPLGEHEPDPADETAVRSKAGFKVVDWVPKKTWSKGMNPRHSSPRARQ